MTEEQIKARAALQWKLIALMAGAAFWLFVIGWVTP